MNIFFNKPENLLIVKSCIESLKQKLVYPQENIVEENNPAYHLKTILDYISRAPDEFDQNCTFSVETVGDSFLNFLGNIINTKDETEKDKLILKAFALGVRFVFELKFVIGEGKELTFDLSSALEAAYKILDNIDSNKIYSEIKSNLIYSAYYMPVSIAKKLIHHRNIKSINEFNKLADQAISFKDEWNKEIQEKQDAVNNLKNKLEEQKTEYNFVGLSKAFSDLSRTKRKEIKTITLFLFLLGLMIAAPFLNKFLFLSIHYTEIDKYKNVLLYSIIPTIGWEIVMIYFFRVVHHNYTSIKTQLLQLDLRRSLCEFIQNYCDYSKDIKNKDNIALDKFENLIFSGIIMNDNQLPSTYDGLNQIAEIVSKIKG